MQAPQKSQFDSWIAPPGSEGDLGGRALAGEADRAGVAEVGAGADAARADDAHLRVELEERVGAVDLGRRRLVVRARLADPGLVELAHVDQLGRGLQLAAVVLAAGQAAMGDDVVAEADLARLAVDAAVAGEAAVRVVRHDQRHHLLAGALDLGLLGVHDHAVDDRGRARELQRLGPAALDLDDAGAAPGVRLEAVDVAEVRDANALLFDHLDELAAAFGLDLRAVERDRRHRGRLRPVVRGLRSLTAVELARQVLRAEAALAAGDGEAAARGGHRRAPRVVVLLLAVRIDPARAVEVGARLAGQRVAVAVHVLEDVDGVVVAGRRIGLAWYGQASVQRPQYMQIRKSIS